MADAEKAKKAKTGGSAAVKTGANAKTKKSPKKRSGLQNFILTIGLICLLGIGLFFIAYGLGYEPRFMKNTDVVDEPVASGGALQEPGTETGKEKDPENAAKAVSSSAVAEKDENATGAAVEKESSASTGAGIKKPAGKNENLVEPSGSLYPNLFPDMKTSVPEERQSFGNTLFLTFDDGPGAGTELVLDTLKKHGIKATFFVVGNRLTDDTAPLLKRMIEEGHTVGVHTDCHQYKTIYASVEAYLTDFNAVYQKIYDYTGVYPTIFRFPGGSVNSFNKATYRQIIAEMKARGFTYYDWNISTGDATVGATADSIYAGAVAGLKYKDTGRNAILLAHDINETSAGQMDAIITAYEEAGFSFAPLSPIVKPVVF